MFSFRKISVEKPKVVFDRHASEVGRRRLGEGEEASVGVAQIPEPFKSAHAFSWKNRAAIEASLTCGCFYCGHVVASSGVVEFHDDAQTGFCPRCGIDALLPSSSGLPLTIEFLERMNQHWFGHGFVNPYGS